MDNDDMDALSLDFSTASDDDAHPREGFDERQRRWPTSCTGESRGRLRSRTWRNSRLSQRQGSRALAQIQREFLTAGKDRDPVGDLMRKRRAALETVTGALRKSLAMTDQDRETLIPLDGRVAARMEATTILM